MSNEPAQYGFTHLDECPPARGKIYLPSAVDISVVVGEGSVIWRYTTILAGTTIGTNVVIGACCFVGRDCCIGEGSRIHPGAALPDGALLGKRVYVGSNVTLANVAYPTLADKTQEVRRPPVIEDDVMLGANCVVLPGVVIGCGARVGAGSVVTHDVPAGATVLGNPARVKRTRHLVLACNEAGEVVGS